MVCQVCATKTITWPLTKRRTKYQQVQYAQVQCPDKLKVQCPDGFMAQKLYTPLVHAPRKIKRSTKNDEQFKRSTRPLPIHLRH